MQYYNHYSDDYQSPRLKEVVSLRRYVQTHLPVSRSPFLAARWYRKFYKVLVMNLIDVIEKRFGRTLYTHMNSSFFLNISAETRALLLYLSKNNYISGWKFDDVLAGNPTVHFLDLSTPSFFNRDGKQVEVIGSIGTGGGDTLDLGSRIAISEFVERQVTTVHEDRQVSAYPVGRRKHILIDYVGSEHETRKGRPVEYTDIEWAQAYDWQSQQSVYLPAQLLFSGYWSLKDKDFSSVMVGESSSSGSASYLTHQESQYRAIMELVERDSLLWHWYKGHSPEIIDWRSLLEHEDIIYQDLLHSFRDYPDRDLHIVNTTTDLGIPSFVGITIFRGTIELVGTVMASDVDPIVAINKMLKELITMMHPNGNWRDIPNKPFTKKEEVSSMAHRVAFWTKGFDLDNITWFVGGSQVSLDDYLSRPDIDHLASVNRVSEKISMVRQIMKENNIAIYCRDYHTPLTKYTGLHVVRAVSPDLIPIFFNENNRPMNVRRFTHNSDGTRATIQDIPHSML